MKQCRRLYESAHVWDQRLQAGQGNLIQAITDFMPGGVQSALDVGCGDGKITHSIAEASGIPFVGLDLSVEALSRCRFPVFVGDAACLPFGASRYDLVMANDVLEHLPEDIEAAAWRELFRVAKKWVMVTVPFREELLDATAQCRWCGTKYHVNWHMRSYDVHQLLPRMACGWRPAGIVLSGEPWSPMQPLETRFRREILGEWSGWAETTCPKCGGAGYPAAEPSSISGVLAAALGKLVYATLWSQGLHRNHSEILLLFGRADGPAFQGRDLPTARSVDRRASEIDLLQEPFGTDLAPYPQKARAVRDADGNIVVQFPVYEATNALHLRWGGPDPTPIAMTVEDAFGQVFYGILKPDGSNDPTVHLSRDAVSGYYGLIVRLPPSARVTWISLSGGPVGTYLEPVFSRAASYHRLSLGSWPLSVQVTRPQWFDTRSLDPQSSTGPAHGWGELFAEIGRVADADRKTLQREADELAVHVQNLTAERDALLVRAREADALAVQVQNLLTERDALLVRAREADALAVEVQNITATLHDLGTKLEILEKEIGDMRRLPEVRLAGRLRKLLHSAQTSNSNAAEKNGGKGRS